MGYRKGKASHRVKDWDRRRREGDEDILDESAAAGQTLQPQRVKLGADRFGGEAGPTEPAPAGQEEALGAEHAAGMVTGMYPGGAYVRVGERRLLCSLGGTFRGQRGKSALAVGDNVVIAIDSLARTSGGLERDKQRAEGVIINREKRATVLARPQPSSGKRRGQYDDDFEKVVVANMDVLLVVVATCRPKLRSGLIDRFLIIAERGGMSAVVVMNKIDLAPPDPEVVEDIKAAEVAIFNVSAATGAGLGELLTFLGGKRSVLAGASGVGKSSLVNALLPGEDVATRPVREKDDRGRHVTAAVSIYDLPGGGLLVDTPGVRELAVDMDVTELPWYFPELAALAPQCKFNDCSHTHEPQCAVRQAAEEGRIPPRRFVAYLKILETLED